MRKNVLITGATGGIGKELCRQFAGHGYDVVLTGRSELRLSELSKELQEEYAVNAFYFACDFLNPYSCEELYRELKRQNIEIDILCNNAGFGIYGDFLDNELPAQQEMLEVNIRALTELCYFFGGDMRKRRSGRIINVSSIAGFMPGPYMALYYASKAFILSFTAALAKELQPYHVSVCALCPGIIQTPFYAKARADLRFSYLLRNMPPEPANQFAEKAYRRLMNRHKTVVVIGLKNKILILLSRLCRIRMTSGIVAWIQRKKQKNQE